MWMFPADVAGSLSEAEGRCLADYAERKIVLEIGSYCGRSTICMAQTASRLYSVDWHKGDKDVGGVFTLATFIAELSRYKVRDKVSIFMGDSAEVCPILKSGIADLVFVDGGHQFATELHDLTQAKRLLARGGVLAVHDRTWDEVIRAVVAAGLGEPSLTVDNLAIFLPKDRGC